MIKNKKLEDMSIKELQAIILETNALAREFYLLLGFKVEEDFDFYREAFMFAKPLHPQERYLWRQACMAQKMLKGIDIDQIDISDVMAYEPEEEGE